MADDNHQKKEGPLLHRGPDHQAPYPVSRLAPAIDLVDVARQIEQADQMIGTRVNAKLRVIADQIKALQEEARAVLAEAQRDQDLHRARITFNRRPGHIYHLYRKEDGSLYFSMLSPEDWQDRPPHPFVGSFRLEADLSWTPLEEVDRPDDTQALVNRLLDT